MIKHIKTGTIAMMIICGSICLTTPDSAAATAPKLNIKKASLTISVGNGINTYGKKTIKIKNKKSFKIKKITFISKNDKIAKVSKKGKITAQSPGKTGIKVTIKYQSKYTYYPTVKKKKITVPVTVAGKYLLDIPQTGMQYDETGKAKPIYPFTKQYDGKGVYSNDTSYIDRFPVYVETDYDTDQDGKRDLIMAFVQVPRSATLGYYKAPVLMEADPYLVDGHRPGNGLDMLTKSKDNAFDNNLLTSSPDPRVPQTEITTSDAVSGASAWVYDMQDRDYLSSSLDYYDYYLIRGYAFVTSPGLGGSTDCDGFQCCGEKVEAEAYAAIIEWLHGDRNGYADREGTKLIKADWCNGHTAMTGLSYVGTMAYEVSTLGVKGLDTVIPCGAIASWYDYIYSQGLPIALVTNYMSYLGDSCAKRWYYPTEDDEKADPLYKRYTDYLFQKTHDEVKTDGKYGEYWKRFEFYKAKPTVPALLVEGLNDCNVYSRQTSLMRKAYIDAGCVCKVLLHQGRHDTLANPSGDMKIGDEYYNDLINRWLAHYMAGIDNGIDRMDDFTVQSNVDGSWTSYNEGRSMDILKLAPSSETTEDTIRFDNKKIEKKLKTTSNENEIQMKTAGMHAVWEHDIDKDTTISGTGEVHLRVKMSDVKKNNPALSVILMDTSNEDFDIYIHDPDQEIYYARTYYGSILDQGDGLSKRYDMMFTTEPGKECMITNGTANLSMPNATWDPETCIAPAEPIRDDTYYDYTVYLNPKDYTLKKGHTLKLYIIGPDIIESYYDIRFVDKYSDPLPYYVTMASKYDFTIDNAASYAELPIVKE